MARAHAQRLKLRLFLEGVEIPVISANIQCTPNAPIVCDIQIPPLAEATKLLPRTIVHLFFLDFYQQINPFINGFGSEAGEAGTTDPTAYEQSLQNARKHNTNPEAVQNALFDTANHQYKMLFGGEIVGFTWSKKVSDRSIILHCEDFSNYWDYAYQWSNSGIFGPGIKAVFSGGSTNLFTDFLQSKGSAITALVSQGRCNTFPNLKGLAAGLIRLLEAIGGVYHIHTKDLGFGPGRIRKIRGQNIFFSLAELRLHLTHMISAIEDDDTSLNLLKRQGYSWMFSRALGSLGGQTSMRQAINALTKIIFHETYSQPCPLYTPGTAGTVTGLVRKKLSDDPEANFISVKAAAILQSIEDLGKAIGSLLKEKDLFRETANAVRKEGLDAKKLSILNDAKDIPIRLGQIIADARQLQSQIRKLRRSELGAATGLLSTAINALRRSKTLMGRAFIPDASEKKKFAIVKKQSEAARSIKKIAELTFSTQASKDMVPARLQQQIIRPDIWFGAPPRCNVLFPEQYYSIDYKRMFLQEPTRFLLKTSDEFLGENFLTDKHYFAPQAGSTRAEQTQLQDILKNSLLDHEVFTGILPVYEKMGQFNVFASRAGTDRGKISKVGFAQRSANFIYFKHRFNARRMIVKGRFNPYIAVGFPGLIIDKYADANSIKVYNDLVRSVEQMRGTPSDKTAAKFNDEDLAQQEISSLLGTNFLGNFTQVVHRIHNGQMMGETEIVCSYPRQPDESVEFLGTLDKDKFVRKREGSDASRADIFAAVTSPRLFTLGPNGGRISNVVDVTGNFSSLNLNDNTLPVFTGTLSNRSQKRPTLVQVGVPIVASQLAGADAVVVEELAGGVDIPVVFKAFLITEAIPRYKRIIVELPAEEYIRPGWYGDVWTSSRIGKAYETFFRTGAITDVQTITGPGGSTIPQTTAASEDALSDRNQAADQEDPRADAPAITALEEGASIQQAVEFLLLTYSFIRSGDVDVEEFIRSYTWRPIASMVDMFGTFDLQFNDDASSVVSGIEGFHSRAFGPYDNLFGLVGPEVEDILNIKRGDPTAQKVDVRKRRLDAVQRLAAGMRFSRAILG